MSEGAYTHVPCIEALSSGMTDRAHTVLTSDEDVGETFSCKEVGLSKQENRRCERWIDRSVLYLFPNLVELEKRSVAILRLHAIRISENLKSFQSAATVLDNGETPPGVPKNKQLDKKLSQYCRSEANRLKQELNQLGMSKFSSFALEKEANAYAKLADELENGATFEELQVNFEALAFLSIEANFESIFRGIKKERAKSPDRPLFVISSMFKPNKRENYQDPLQRKLEEFTSDEGIDSYAVVESSL